MKMVVVTVVQFSRATHTGRRLTWTRNDMDDAWMREELWLLAVGVRMSPPAQPVGDATMCRYVASGSLWTRAKNKGGWHDGLPRRCLSGSAKTVKALNAMTGSMNPYVGSLPEPKLRSSSQREEREAGALVTAWSQPEVMVFEGETPTQGSALQPIR